MMEAPPPRQNITLGDIGNVVDISNNNNNIEFMSCMDDENDTTDDATTNSGVERDHDPCGTTATTATTTTASSSVPPPMFENILVVPQRLTKHAQKILFPLRASPLSYHLEGRFGSRTHRIDENHMGIPLLDSIGMILDLASRHSELDDLIHHTDDVRICHNLYMPPPRHRAREPPEIDGRIHPERQQSIAINDSSITESPTSSFLSSPPTSTTPPSSQSPLFTYAELFAGMGGFGVALDALGGRCVFCSELEEHLRAVYRHNFVTLPNHRQQQQEEEEEQRGRNGNTEQDPPPIFDIPIFGDIYQVDNSDFPQSLDLLVGGFPCQPFSALGEQPGLDCPRNRGNLFQQIVRCLNASRPKAFLLENVPGLLTMTETYKIIVQALADAGYDVMTEVCSSRGLTATGRKRLFFVGLRKTDDRPTSTKRDEYIDGNVSHKVDGSCSTPSDLTPTKAFDFPFVPDLRIRSRDVLDYDDLPAEELEILRLSDDTFEQLLNGGHWRAHNLAWPNKSCETLISHYGNAVGRGESQLVPCSAPHNPRRFSVRECARLMGFPNSYEFLEPRQHQSPMGYRKEHYRMIGNAVCPPLVAALAGAVLNHIQFDDDPSLNEWDWIQRGRDVAIQLALAATRPKPARLPRGCLLPSEYAKYGSSPSPPGDTDGCSIGTE